MINIYMAFSDIIQLVNGISFAMGKSDHTHVGSSIDIELLDFNGKASGIGLDYHASSNLAKLHLSDHWETISFDLYRSSDVKVKTLSQSC